MPRIRWTAFLPALTLPLVLPIQSHARPPLFRLEPIPAQSARVQQLFGVGVRYVVEDEVCFEGIGFSLDQAPPGMIVGAGGRISWIPLPGEQGRSFEVVVRARGSRS